MNVRQSLNQSHLFRNLNGLCTTFGAEFIQQTARVRFNRVLADEELFRNLTVTHSLRNQLEDLELTFGNSQIANSFCIDYKRFCDRNGDFLKDYNFLFSSQLESKPDPNTRKQDGRQAAIDLDGVLDNDKSIFDVLQKSDENAAAKSVDESVNEGPFVHRRAWILQRSLGLVGAFLPGRTSTRSC